MIKESPLSRIWKHINSDTSFAIVSAYSKEYDEEENYMRHQELLSDIKVTKLGYIELKSGYTYTNDKGAKGTMEERSFFITSIPKEKALELGRKYRQGSIIYNDKDGFSLIRGSDGYVEMSFAKGTDSNMNFSKKNVKNAFFQLAIPKYKNIIKQFTFTVKELAIPDWIVVYKAKKEKTGPPHVKYIDIF
jgi:hypothetical protein